MASAATACANLLGIDDVSVKDGGIGSLDDAAPDSDKTSDSGSDSALGNGYASVVRSDSPIGYWKLDDVGTVAVDSSSHGLDATYGPGVVHGPPIVSGGGASADFPGSPDGGFQGSGITLPPNALLEMTGALTIEAWIRPFSGNRSELVTYGQQDVAPYQPWGLQYAPPLELFTSCCGVVDGTNPLTPDRKSTYYLVATFDPVAGITLYVNGVPDGDGGAGGTLGGYDNVNGLGIGVGADGTLPFTGLIDEVAIYDKKLSVDRILAHYDAGK